MIRNIITTQQEHGLYRLTQTSKPLGCEGFEYVDRLITDLLDTARSCTRPTCAGMTASQIGEPVQVFVMQWGAEYITVINPVVVSKSEKTCPYWERCISRPGLAPVNTRRHKTITLEYLEHVPRRKVVRTFKNRDAIIVQHCMDHFDGVDV
jgi:peptide deformylase